MEVKHLVDEILPRTKILLVNHEADLKTKINEWLSKKGFITRFVGKNLVDPIWKLIIGPLLPIIVEKSILIILGIISPYIAPFVPALIMLLEYISLSILTNEDKYKIKDILELIKSFKPDDEISGVISSDPWLVAGALNNQEYFDGKP